MNVAASHVDIVMLYIPVISFFWITPASIRAINRDCILLVIERILQLLIQQVGRRNATNYTDKKHLISFAALP